MNNIHESAIFWLDGHYSAGFTAKGDTECPIFEELAAIFSSKIYNPIILIDDARCFRGNENYPSIEKITDYIRNKNEKYHMAIKDDIIRFFV